MKYSITAATIMVAMADGAIHTITKGEDEERYTALRAGLIAGEDVSTLLVNEEVTTIVDWSEGALRYEDGKLTYEGAALPEALADQIVANIEADTPWDVYLKFWLNLRENPSHRSVNQLFGFLTQNTGFPLTPDGCFIAYKGVTREMTDAYSKKIDNNPGQVVLLPRNQISDDPNLACHFGLHVGAWEYASTFSQVTVAVKVNPRDVVCVPHARSQQKVRVCEYEVMEILSDKLTEGIYGEEEEAGGERGYSWNGWFLNFPDGALYCAPGADIEAHQDPQWVWVRAELCGTCNGWRRENRHYCASSENTPPWRSKTSPVRYTANAFEVCPARHHDKLRAAFKEAGVI